MPEPAAAQLRHGRAAGRDDRYERERDLVTDAALVFGFFDSLQQKFAVIDTLIPSEFLAMAPYLVTIIIVAGLVGRARPPAADGVPYEKQ